MSAPGRPAEPCPHCGAPLQAPASSHAPGAPKPVDPRYDLHELAQRAREESAHDEGAKVRVTQGDIRRLLDKRRKERK